MRVLVACEYSGKVREAFRKKGHEAWSCDLLPSDDNSDFHIQGDVTELLKQPWDLMVAHPPCTYITNSGVSWLHKDVTRWPKLFDATQFFRLLLEADVEKICVENPIPHKYAREWIHSNYTQIVHPYMFGHKEQKATCLWLKGLPELIETDNVKVDMMKLSKKERERLHYLPPSEDRWKLRSETYQGIADAMAEQWG